MNIEKIVYKGCEATITSKIPLGFMIWNVHMENGYVPFCRLSFKQPFPGGRQIETKDIRLVKMEIEEMEVMSLLAGQGLNTIFLLKDQQKKTPLIKKGIKIFEKYL